MTSQLKIASEENGVSSKIWPSHRAVRQVVGLVAFFVVYDMQIFLKISLFDFFPRFECCMILRVMSPLGNLLFTRTKSWPWLERYVLFELLIFALLWGLLFNVYVAVSLQDVGDGWWEGISPNGNRGLFPEAYVEVKFEHSSFLERVSGKIVIAVQWSHA